MSLKRLLIISGVTGVLLISMVFLVVTSRRSTYPIRGGSVGLFIVAPFQDMAVSVARFTEDIWYYYFSLASAARENDRLEKKISQLKAENQSYREIALANERLRRLLNFHKETDFKSFAAQVVARDPSGWFKSVIIDKGASDGVKRSMPVVVSEGIVGQVIEVSLYYSKVLLIIDQNSAVDVLCQRTRARGVLKGGAHNRCQLKYVLRKADIRVGDIVISSGLDGVYPKGLCLGRVSGLSKQNAGVFQNVQVDPFVDFDKLEEVLVLLASRELDFSEKK